MTRWLAILLLCGAAQAGDFVPFRWPNPSVATHTDMQPGRWNRVDLTEHVADASHALLHGLLVITHGETPAMCTLHVWFRIPGEDGTALTYMGQAVATVGGIRQNHSILIPLRRIDGRLVGEMWYDTAPVVETVWPESCAFGFT